MRRFLLALVTLLGPALYGQPPSAGWRAVETEHFRVHYPREYEEWALRAAERLEPIREAVAKEVGYAPPQKIDVIVSNPFAEPNGVAWPLPGTPRMIFFAEPPGPDEQLGNYTHWLDLLAVHETAHLVHMLRPSRNPLARLLPLTPVTLGAPRWVLEGYATVIEGRLTGGGRPNSALRALILRQWAAHGRLPSYGQVNSDQRFLGMSMAYLAGSAYLEWLERRSGPESLRNLWSRMTARQRRSFHSAFAGVFGDSPERLYGLFVAELTAISLAARDDERVEGTLFQDTPRASGSPAVSPDGSQIALVLRPRDEPAKLVVWSTAPPIEEEQKFAERIEQMLKRDPEDVAPVRTRPLPRKALHSLVLTDGGDIETPRWTRDGKAILFSHRMPDAHGDLHYDLFRWDFAKVTRITYLGDVRDADPAPDGRTAVAVRNRFGASQLVNVDLETGQVTRRTEPSIDVVETHPRFSPDGTQVAHVANRAGRWTLYIDDRAVPLDGDAATPEWTPDGELVVTVLAGGFAELYASRNGTFAPITRIDSGAFEPAPSADGRVFFMSLDPDGYALRVVSGSEELAVGGWRLAADGRLTFEERQSLGRRAGDPSPSFAPPPLRLPGAAAVRDDRESPYNRPLEKSWFIGGHAAPGGNAIEVGLRLGDVIGRLDAIVIGSTDGAALAGVWRGWPVDVGAHLFLRDGDSGGEARATWSRYFPRSRLIVDGGASVSQAPGSSTANESFAFGSAHFSTRQVIGSLRFDEAVRVELDGGHYRAVAAAAARKGSFGLSARWQHDAGEEVTLGGIASSLMPRSAYARSVLDPALPVAILSGRRYDGWRIETSLPSMPFTAFYQRHDLDGRTLSLAGARVGVSADPNPILKLPGLELTVGAAYVLDEPLRGEMNWWLGVRWRP